MMRQKKGDIKRSACRLVLLLILSCGLAVATAAWAGDIQTLEVVEVTDSPENLTGATDASSEGVVPQKQVQAQVTYDPGEVLQVTPGLVVTQHSGEGKANQYFLRGVNLDHGTDLRIAVDGMLVNQRTNAHGQGYADLNFLIPELVKGIQYRKGPYYADEGDFSSVGAVSVDYVDKLERGFAQVTGGQNNYARALLADSVRLGQGNLLFGSETLYNDGPWTNPEHFRKFNGVLRYSLVDAQDSFIIEAMGYHSQGNATNQIAQRAFDEGLIGRFGSLNTSDGTNNSRYSLSGAWQHTSGTSVTRANAYVIASSLDLFSDFTYFLNDPVHGDQFEQTDRRVTEALNVSHSWLSQWGGREIQHTVGLQTQNDNINVGLNHTENRQLLFIIRSDRVMETSEAFYYQAGIAWLPKFRTETGVRTDFYQFRVNSNNPANSGTASAHMTNPKLSLVFGPWEKTEYFVNAGGGFHSNDARGTTITQTPGSGPDANLPAQKVTPLVRTKGYEIGARTQVVPHLRSSLTFYRLDFDSELVFQGDAGTTSPGRPSRRLGFEFVNEYTPWPWLTLAAEFAYAQARFTAPDPDPSVHGDHIPGAVEGVGTFRVAVDNQGSWFGSAQVRYVGPYALIENNTERSAATTLVNGRLGYRVNKRVNLVLDGINLFNAKVSNIEYYYTSRLPGEPAAGVNDIHFHPVEPLTFRLGVIYYF